jgi:hypothetical protein
MYAFVCVDNLDYLDLESNGKRVLHVSPCSPLVLSLNAVIEGNNPRAGWEFAVLHFKVHRFNVPYLRLYISKHIYG